MKTGLLNSQGKYTQNRVLIISTYSGKGKLKKNCTKAKRLFSFCFNTAIRMIAPTDNVTRYHPCSHSTRKTDM